MNAGGCIGDGACDTVFLGGPGLGIELDPDAVARAAENHIREVPKLG